MTASPTAKETTRVGKKVKTTEIPIDAPQEPLHVLSVTHDSGRVMEVVTDVVETAVVGSEMQMLIFNKLFHSCTHYQ